MGQPDRETGGKLFPNALISAVDDDTVAPAVPDAHQTIRLEFCRDSRMGCHVACLNWFGHIAPLIPDERKSGGDLLVGQFPAICGHCGKCKLSIRDH